MSHCEKVKVDRVLCDEIFFVQSTPTEVPFPTTFPPDATAARIQNVDAELVVTKCNVILTDPSTGLFLPHPRLILEIAVDEFFELVAGIGTGPEEVFEQEYSFRFTRTVDFHKCTAAEIDALVRQERFGQLKCQIFDVRGDVDLVVNFPARNFLNTVTAQIKAKLVQEIQTFVALCPDVNRATLTVNQTGGGL